MSLRDILQELAKADSVRTLKDAPAPGTDNAVTTMLEKMLTTLGFEGVCEAGHVWNSIVRI